MRKSRSKFFNVGARLLQLALQRLRAIWLDSDQSWANSGLGQTKNGLIRTCDIHILHLIFIPFPDEVVICVSPFLTHSGLPKL